MTLEVQQLYESACASGTIQTKAYNLALNISS